MEEKDEIQETEGLGPTGEDEEVDESDLEEEGEGAQPDGGEGKEPESEGEDSKPHRQSRKTNAEYARLRRERKAKEEAERLERESQIRRQAEFDVKKGMVGNDELADLGLEAIESKEDLALVEAYRKAKADGEENPIAEAYKSLAKANREAKRKADADAKEKSERDEEAKRAVAKEQAAVKAKYGKNTWEILKEEPEFQEFFSKFGQVGNFDECYSTFTKMKGNSEDAAKRAGVFPTSGSGRQGGTSSEMSDKEFAEYFKRKYQS